MTDHSKKRQSLGRGLDALFGEPAAEDQKPRSRDAGSTGSTAGKDAPVSTGATTGLAVAQIKPGRYQPRHRFDDDAMTALTASIREKGVITPVLVRPHPEDSNAYELIAGERRWRAAQRAQLHEIPAIVRTFTDAEALEIGLVENVQRQDLTPIEEGEGYQRLMDEFEHTQEALSRIVGRSRSHVANMLRILGLPDDIKAMVDAGDLTAGHARALLAAHDPKALAKRIVAKGLSVREAERLAKRPAETSKVSAPGAAKPKDADTLALERDLTNSLGLKVRVNPKGESGSVLIEYANLEQLDDLLERLGKRSPDRSAEPRRA